MMASTICHLLSNTFFMLWVIQTFPKYQWAGIIYSKLNSKTRIIHIHHRQIVKWMDCKCITCILRDKQYLSQYQGHVTPLPYIATPLESLKLFGTARRNKLGLYWLGWCHQLSTSSEVRIHQPPYVPCKI